MKRFFLVILLVLIAVTNITACKKPLTAKDYPLVLFDVDLTPGEKENEVTVFLYTSYDKVDFKITHKKDNFLVLELENTIKAKTNTDLPVGGLEELIQNARIIQIVQRKKGKDIFKTRIIFKLLEKNTTLKTVIQVREMEVKKIKKIIDSSEAIKVIARTVNIHSDENNNIVAIALIVSFWVLLLAILGIYWLLKKIKQNPA